MHAPLQASWPGAQPHLPATHEVPPVQVVPHAPQFVSSVFRSTQELLQFVRPDAQPAAQAPFEQTAIVLTQFVPHAPQFVGSFDGSTQTEPQRRKPAGQEQTPAPPSGEGPHVSVAPHAVVHAPQWFGSLVVSTQD